MSCNQIVPLIRNAYWIECRIRCFSLEEEGPPLSTKEIRLATILRELPYAIAFPQRVIVFSNLVSKDKEENQPDRVQYMQGTSINITVRRTYIYEDSFEKLSPENGEQVGNVRIRDGVRVIDAFL